GSVHADSAGAGRGATFTVTLPIAAAKAVGEGNGQKLDHHTPAIAQQSAAGADSSEELPRLSGVHVLLVDDEADAREVVAEMLHRFDARVTTAASTREALALLESLRPDVIISDIAMPDQDGFDLIRAVRGRAAEQGGQVPAVALTAYARPEDADRCLRGGFQRHLAKPVDPRDLIACVARLGVNAPELPGDRPGLNDADIRIKLRA
ncbi:MAG: response regulator, partial [Tepidisphaeraceae bacterium]